MKSNNMFLNANLLIAGIILIGGVLLLLPQNGVMAWIESGSVDTITDDMASVNMVFSDGITSSVEGINHLNRNLFDDDDDSPLGTIRITIKSSDLEDLVNWLTSFS